MMFRKEFGTANVTSLVERVSRFTLLARNPEPPSKPTIEDVIAGLSPLPQQARRSITFDRGTEFSAWLPRRADPTALAHAHMKAICTRLNASPRKCLGYQTPDEIFRAKLLEIMRTDG